MASDCDYEFEMFSLRKDILAVIAERVREGDFVAAKNEAARLIRFRSEGDAEKNAKAFRTSFDKAREMVEEGGDYELEIEPLKGIVADHDAEIDPSKEIDGETVEVITSTDKTEFRPESSTYPVVDHPSGYRVCTCPAQKYYILCPHTLARVIERNWADAPVPA